MELSEISVWVEKTRGVIRNLCEGVRDPWRNPKFLCGCKRPVEISEISVWIIRGSQCRLKSSVAREMKRHGHIITKT